jgi:hypothetical protein
MQALDPAKLIGPFLYLFRRHGDTLFLRRTDRKFVSNELFNETLELSCKLQCPYEILDANDFVIDSHNRRHLIRSLTLGTNSG